MPGMIWLRLSSLITANDCWILLHCKINSLGLSEPWTVTDYWWGWFEVFSCECECVLAAYVCRRREMQNDKECARVWEEKRNKRKDENQEILIVSIFVHTPDCFLWDNALEVDKISIYTNDRNFLFPTEGGLKSMSASNRWLIKVNSWPPVADSSFSPYCF